jgi:RND family efflux transporter MFP subunit
VNLFNKGKKENTMVMATQFNQESDVRHAADKGGGAVQEQPKRPAPRTTWKVAAFLSAGALAAAGLVAAGVAPRVGRGAALAEDAKAVAAARRAVSVVSPTRDGTAYTLRLPATTAPLQSAVLYARTNGYLKSFHVDIGDRVKAGTVLAEIESPETDAQLREARATLEQNRANLALVAQRLERSAKARQAQAVAQGEVDDLTAQHNAAVAALHVSEAVVSRLETDQSFQKVAAPFDGVVTQRNVELGSLVSAGSAAGVTPLFRLEQDNVLKVLVDVPQTAATGVAVGQAVGVEIREHPGRRYEGKVVRTAGSVDASTRTLRTEVHLPNADGSLLAGMYAQVHLAVADPRDPLLIPAAALVLDAAGTQVVTVDGGGAVRRKSVTLGRDLGRQVEVTTGLAGGEKLVVNPRDDLRDGQVVDVR